MTIACHIPRGETMSKVSVAEAKSHLSELIARSAHGHERFIITRRDHPVAAIVSLRDLTIIEQYEERQGLAALVGLWPNFEELAESIENLEELRNQGGSGREVSF
jgi:prevent-host-death family protein